MKIKKFGDRSAVKQHIGEHSLTQQNFAGETDVNNIMRKYEKTGILTHVHAMRANTGTSQGSPTTKRALNASWLRTKCSTASGPS